WLSGYQAVADGDGPLVAARRPMLPHHIDIHLTFRGLPGYALTRSQRAMRRTGGAALLARPLPVRVDGGQYLLDVLEGAVAGDVHGVVRRLRAALAGLPLLDLPCHQLP